MGAPKQTPAQIEAKKQALLALIPDYLKNLLPENIKKFNESPEGLQIKKLKEFKKGLVPSVKFEGTVTAFPELRTALNAFNSLVTKKISKLTVKEINTIKDLLKKSDELIDFTLIENEKAEKAAKAEQLKKEIDEAAKLLKAKQDELKELITL